MDRRHIHPDQGIRKESHYRSKPARHVPAHSKGDEGRGHSFFTTLPSYLAQANPCVMSRHPTFAEVEGDQEKYATQHVDGLSVTATESRGKDSVYPTADIEDSKAVRKLLTKLDLCILPFAVLLYLSAYLDRGNL